MATSILLFSLLLVLPCFVDSVYFNFTSFQRGDPGNVIYHGDASPDGAAVLNNIGYAGRVGWVTYAEKVPIWSSKTGKLTDFNTSFSFIIDTRNKNTCHARISYDSVTKSLSVSWTYKLTYDPRENSSLSYIIDLAKVLPPHVMIGFSATTGNVTEGQRLLSWEFIEKASVRTGLIVGISVSGFVFLFSSVIFVLVWLHKKRKRKAKEITDFTSMINEEDLDKEAGPRRFAYKDLEIATNRFSPQRKLGEGGFGAVYRGFLNEIDMFVAVKKLSGRSRQGKREFLTEVKIISKLRHRNLVQLIGWCSEKHEYLLIYEFMPNGSLDTHLFGKRPHLCRDVRYKVALGLASALLYLHDELDRCVLHRDIKARNIMLDTNFNVKLGDFGLARLMDHELRSHTTGLAGTFGYMAPEYVMTGRASKESDIYSFGVSILEIVTGIKSLDHSAENIESTSLVERVWDLYGRQQLMSAMDEKLGEEFNREQAECLAVVGLWCGHPDRNSRPSIRQAIQVLNLESPLPNLPQKMPVPMYYISPTSLTVSSSRGSVTFSSCQVGR
ncbi:hypothetical protein Bca52824_022104 [Brassica carinata]|uniref:Protein kinase domain-containing protein n=1 Tax=Brassica carinata TaxID=52824 RepID=A0A8X7VFV1_BRACI|nr:hypothetical protein Bca52824_022104 [Brassica carinata]